MPKYGTDYSKTALELKNPLEVRDLLLAYDRTTQLELAAEAAYNEAAQTLPETVILNKARTASFEARKRVQEAVERAGRFQDIAEGQY